MTNTVITGTINVSDGLVGYTAHLTGDWTIEQIRSAFLDGYGFDPDTEVDRVRCRVQDEDGEELGRFSFRPGDQPAAYPHKVRWIA